MGWEGDKGPPYKFGMGPSEGLIRPCCAFRLGLLFDPLYTSIPIIRLACLDCVLRSAARLIGKIRSRHQKLAETCPKYGGETKVLGERW